MQQSFIHNTPFSGGGVMSNLISAAVQRRIVGSATRKSVLLYMADRASDDGSGIWTSKANIARDLELSTRAVQLAIHALIGAGLVREAGQRDCKHGFTVEYSILLGAVDNLLSTRESRSPVAAKTLSTPESGSPHPLNQIHPNNPYKDTTIACASAGPVDNSPQGRCLAAAGRGLCPAGWQAIVATGDVIDGWLAEGFDLEQDVLPVIASRTVSMRIAPIRTWGYFSDAVREGVAHLKALVEELGRTPVTVPPTSEWQAVGWGSSGRRYAHEMEERARQSTVEMALKDIADVQGDVDRATPCTICLQ